MEDFAGDGASFTVTLSGIILDPEKKKVLITRGSGDKKKWGFPHGILRAKTKIDDFLKRVFRKNIGYDIEIIGPVFSSISPKEGNELHIHYLCEIIGDRNIEKKADMKWVNPNELKRYIDGFSESALYDYITELI